MATLAIYVTVACLAAMWAAYWLSEMLFRPTTRASKIACFVSPVLIAVPLAIAAGPTLNMLGIDLRNLPLGYQEGSEAVIVVFAILILIPTLLISLVTARMSKRTDDQHRT